MLSNKTIFNTISLKKSNSLSSSFAPIEIQTPKKKKGCMVRDIYNNSNNKVNNSNNEVNNLQEEDVIDPYHYPNELLCLELREAISKAFAWAWKNNWSKIASIESIFIELTKYECYANLGTSESREICKKLYGDFEYEINRALSYGKYGRSGWNTAWSGRVYQKWNQIESTGCMLPTF